MSCGAADVRALGNGNRAGTGWSFAALLSELGIVGACTLLIVRECSKHWRRPRRHGRSDLDGYWCQWVRLDSVVCGADYLTALWTSYHLIAKVFKWLYAGFVCVCHRRRFSLIRTGE